MQQRSLMKSAGLLPLYSSPRISPIPLMRSKEQDDSQRSHKFQQRDRSTTLCETSLVLGDEQKQEESSPIGIFLADPWQNRGKPPKMWESATTVNTPSPDTYVRDWLRTSSPYNSMFEDASYENPALLQRQAGRFRSQLSSGGRNKVPSRDFITSCTTTYST